MKDKKSLYNEKAETSKEKFDNVKNLKNINLDSETPITMEDFFKNAKAETMQNIFKNVEDLKKETTDGMVKTLNEYMDNVKKRKEEIAGEEESDFEKRVEKVQNAPISDVEYKYYYGSEKKAEKYKKIHKKIDFGKTVFSLEALLLFPGYLFAIQSYGWTAFATAMIAVALLANNIYWLLAIIATFSLNAYYIESRMFDNKIYTTRVDMLNCTSQEYMDRIGKKDLPKAVTVLLTTGLTLMYWATIVILVALML